MEKSVFMCGSGGQGIMMIGLMLAQSAVKSGRSASCMPSYGPEKRGGMANCTVTYSEEQIISPIVEKITGMIIMNQSTMDAYHAHAAREGCKYIINSSLVGNLYDLKNVYAVPCNDIAAEIGNPKGSNMVALGAFIGATDDISPESIIRGIGEQFSGRQKLIDLNIAAFKAGYDRIKNKKYERRAGC